MHKTRLILYNLDITVYLWLKRLNVAGFEVDGFPSSGVHVLIGLFWVMAYPFFFFFFLKKKPTSIGSMFNVSLFVIIIFCHFKRLDLCRAALFFLLFTLTITIVYWSSAYWSPRVSLQKSMISSATGAKL